ncbi:hypothetical protein P7K49_019946 [Saguinus oedipus]|uniref:Uncharacterized protein n=1 Tax=Saguinus oedipus TaxID=9490 RepID=A0ABQ9UZT4_SAGOE|nr:hypothetical protein P7K49_019946 [Saguinus oedipus]
MSLPVLNFPNSIDCPFTSNSVLQTNEKFGRIFLYDGESMEEDSLTQCAIGLSESHHITADEKQRSETSENSSQYVLFTGFQQACIRFLRRFRSHKGNEGTYPRQAMAGWLQESWTDPCLFWHTPNSTVKNMISATGYLEKDGIALQGEPNSVNCFVMEMLH